MILHHFGFFFLSELTVYEIYTDKVHSHINFCAYSLMHKIVQRIQRQIFRVKQTHIINIQCNFYTFQYFDIRILTSRRLSCSIIFTKKVSVWVKTLTIRKIVQ